MVAPTTPTPSPTEPAPHADPATPAQARGQGEGGDGQGHGHARMAKRKAAAISGGEEDGEGNGTDVGGGHALGHEISDEGEHTETVAIDGHDDSREDGDDRGAQEKHEVKRRRGRPPKHALAHAHAHPHLPLPSHPHASGHLRARSPSHPSTPPGDHDESAVTTSPASAKQQTPQPPTALLALTPTLTMTESSPTSRRTATTPTPTPASVSTSARDGPRAQSSPLRHIKKEKETDEARSDQKDETSQSRAAATPHPPTTPLATATTFALPEHTSDRLDANGDEYLTTATDPAGEQKVDSNGHLLKRAPAADGGDGGAAAVAGSSSGAGGTGGERVYKCRTFTVPQRADKLFMLATECAHVLGYRDSYLLFNKNKSLHKIIANQLERDGLIAQGILPPSYRARQIAIVSARSMFRQFGSRIIVGGRRVRDDYWEGRARTAGFTENDLASEKKPGGAKAREAAAAAAAAAAEAKARAQERLQPGGVQVVHVDTVGAQTGEVLTSPPSPPSRPDSSCAASAPFVMSMPQPTPVYLAASAATSTILASAVSPSTDPRLREWMALPRAGQDIMGPAWSDKTAPSQPAEVNQQAANAAEFSKMLNTQRAWRASKLREDWARAVADAAPPTPPSEAGDDDDDDEEPRDGAALGRRARTGAAGGTGSGTGGPRDQDAVGESVTPSVSLTSSIGVPAVAVAGGPASLMPSRAQSRQLRGTPASGYHAHQHGSLGPPPATALKPLPSQSHPLPSPQHPPSGHTQASGLAGRPTMQMHMGRPPLSHQQHLARQHQQHQQQQPQQQQGPGGPIAPSPALSHISAAGSVHGPGQGHAQHGAYQYQPSHTPQPQQQQHHPPMPSHQQTPQGMMGGGGLHMPMSDAMGRMNPASNMGMNMGMNMRMPQRPPGQGTPTPALMSSRGGPRPSPKPGVGTGPGSLQGGVGGANGTGPLPAGGGLGPGGMPLQMYGYPSSPSGPNGGNPNMGLGVNMGAGMPMGMKPNMNMGMRGPAASSYNPPFNPAYNPATGQMGMAPIPSEGAGGQQMRDSGLAGSGAPNSGPASASAARQNLARAKADSVSSGSGAVGFNGELGMYPQHQQYQQQPPGATGVGHGSGPMNAVRMAGQNMSSPAMASGAGNGDAAAPNQATVPSNSGSNAGGAGANTGAILSPSDGSFGGLGGPGSGLAGMPLHMPMDQGMAPHAGMGMAVNMNLNMNMNMPMNMGGMNMGTGAGTGMGMGMPVNMNAPLDMGGMSMGTTPMGMPMGMGMGVGPGTNVGIGVGMPPPGGAGPTDGGAGGAGNAGASGSGGGSGGWPAF